MTSADAMAIDERSAFTAAAATFRGVVAQVGDRWYQPGLGEWTVRDLVGHTSRSLVTVEDYLAAEPGAVEVESAADYYRSVLHIAPASVVERGRAAGVALGEDPEAFLADLDARVQALVAAAPDDAFVATAAGGMRLIDYLPTRTFELVVHSADLAVALDVLTTPAADAAASAWQLAGQLAQARGATVDVLLALTGRRTLPTGFSLL
jgi:uncharacterized protein (TIGR03083 family)